LKIVNLYIDNGREYLSNEMRQFCVKKGITYHLTVPHTPQLNGVSERMIRTIPEKPDQNTLTYTYVYIELHF